MSLGDKNTDEFVKYHKLCMNGHPCSRRTDIPDHYEGSDAECDGCDRTFRFSHGYYRCEEECDEDYCLSCIEGEDTKTPSKHKPKPK